MVKERDPPATANAKTRGGCQARFAALFVHGSRLPGCTGRRRAASGMRLRNAVARGSRSVPRFVSLGRRIQRRQKTMRNILALLAAGALVVAGLGWYLGWYHVKSTPSAD